MYERFSDRARKVCQLANQEAQRLNHEFIGTEHLLIGLLKEGSGVAANVLRNLDIDLRKIRNEVEKIVQPGPDQVVLGKLPQTPCAKKVIEYSIEEAKNLNHNYVGTEHILLGLLREQETSVALRVFKNLGVKLEDVREEIVNLLRTAAEEGKEERESNEVIAKHMRTWHCTVEIPVIYATPLDGFAKAFMKQTGFTADKIELCSRMEGDTTHFWFQERVAKPAPVPAVLPEAAGCNCKSLLHGHEIGCPLR